MRISIRSQAFKILSAILIAQIWFCQGAISDDSYRKLNFTIPLPLAPSSNSFSVKSIQAPSAPIPAALVPIPVPVLESKATIAPYKETIAPILQTILNRNGRPSLPKQDDDPNKEGASRFSSQDNKGANKMWSGMAAEKHIMPNRQSYREIEEIQIPTTQRPLIQISSNDGWPSHNSHINISIYKKPGRKYNEKEPDVHLIIPNELYSNPSKAINITVYSDDTNATIGAIGPQPKGLVVDSPQIFPGMYTQRLSILGLFGERKINLNVITNNTVPNVVSEAKEIEKVPKYQMAPDIGFIDHEHRISTETNAILSTKTTQKSQSTPTPVPILQSKATVVPLPILPSVKPTLITTGQPLNPVSSTQKPVISTVVPNNSSNNPNTTPRPFIVQTDDDSVDVILRTSRPTFNPTFSPNQSNIASTQVPKKGLQLPPEVHISIPKQSNTTYSAVPAPINISISNNLNDLKSKLGEMPNITINVPTKPCRRNLTQTVNLTIHSRNAPDVVVVVPTNITSSKNSELKVIEIDIFPDFENDLFMAGLHPYNNSAVTGVALPLPEPEPEPQQMPEVRILLPTNTSKGTNPPAINITIGTNQTDSTNGVQIPEITINIPSKCRKTNTAPTINMTITTKDTSKDTTNDDEVLRSGAPKKPLPEIKITVPTNLANQPTQTSKPINISQPTQPPQTTLPPKTTQPTQTTQPPKTTQPSQTTQPPKTTQPTQTTQPPQATQPTQTTQPTKPTQPTPQPNQLNATTITKKTDPIEIEVIPDFEQLLRQAGLSTDNVTAVTGIVEELPEIHVLVPTDVDHNGETPVNIVVANNKSSDHNVHVVVPTNHPRSEKDQLPKSPSINITIASNNTNPAPDIRINIPQGKDRQALKCKKPIQLDINSNNSSPSIPSVQISIPTVSKSSMNISIVGNNTEDNGPKIRIAVPTNHNKTAVNIKISPSSDDEEATLRSGAPVIKIAVPSNMTCRKKPKSRAVNITIGAPQSSPYNVGIPQIKISVPTNISSSPTINLTISTNQTFLGSSTVPDIKILVPTNVTNDPSKNPVIDIKIATNNTNSKGVDNNIPNIRITVPTHVNSSIPNPNPFINITIGNNSKPHTPEVKISVPTNNTISNNKTSIDISVREAKQNISLSIPTNTSETNKTGTSPVYNLNICNKNVPTGIAQNIMLSIPANIASPQESATINITLSAYITGPDGIPVKQNITLQVPTNLTMLMASDGPRFFSGAIYIDKTTARPKVV